MRQRWIDAPLRTFGAVILTTASLFVVAGGCVRTMVLFGQAMEQEAKPNGALIALAVTIILASLLFIGARAISKDPDDR